MTTVGGTIGSGIPARRLAQGRVQHATRSGLSVARHTNLAASVLALAGVVVPSDVQISLGAGLRFTPGRIAVVLLLIPALRLLFQKGRSLQLCDLLVFATAAWMVVASISSVGMSAVSAAGGDALDFLGGYLIARAYFFGRPALDTFIRVLKVFAIIAVVLAMADTISGRYFWHETIYQPVLRNGWVRAASSFDHPILFGTFCALAAAILLYWEKSLLRRSVSAGVCFLGCLLSLSSAAWMAFAIILAAFTYDQLMGRYSWRWKAFWMVLGILSAIFFVASTHPLNWIVLHLTLDPQTGYFRMMIWDTALVYIAQSPMTGYAYEIFNNDIIDGSVDSIWLLHTLRFGVPMLILFFLANVAVFFPTKRKSHGAADVHMDRMRSAFTLVILMFVFTGFTVHFWNYMWMFWGLCLGVRVSLREST